LCNRAYSDAAGGSASGAAASGGNEVLAMADCAINIKPTVAELAEIAIETAKTA
jgi:phosphotransacetylase